MSGKKVTIPPRADRWVAGEESPREQKPTKKEPAPAKPKSSVMGRPKKLEGPWAKASVVLTEEEILALDRMALDVRAKTRQSISRAELIRAIVDRALASSDACAEITEQILSSKPEKPAVS